MSRSELRQDQLIEIYLVALLFLLVVVGVRIAYIDLSPTPIPCNTYPLYLAMGLLAIGGLFTFVRFHAVISSLFNALGLVQLAFTGAFASVALVIYSGRSFALADADFAALDRAIGFDWLAYMKWFDHHPGLDAIAQFGYESILLQPFLIILALVFTHQSNRVYELISMMVVALVVTCLIALFLPALGPYEYFGVTAADHPHITLITEAKMTAPILWLRAANFNLPMPPVTVGLISFPSYHAATAIIYIWACWRTPILKWSVLGLNTIMLLATPVHGSHYVVDVIVGIAIAVASIAAVQSIVALVIRTRPMALMPTLISAWIRGLSDRPALASSTAPTNNPDQRP